MPTTRNPVPTAMRSPDTVSTLVDGDAVNRDDIFVELAPGGTPKLTLAYLHDIISGLAHPGSMTRVESNLAFDYTSSPTFVFQSGAGGFTIPAGDHIHQMLEQAPHGSTLTAVSVSILPDSHGSLPQNMPNLKVYKVNPVTGANTQIGSTQVDPSGSTPVYDVAHLITVSGLSEVIDRATYAYYVDLTAESGTNSDSNTQYLGAKSTFTV